MMPLNRNLPSASCAAVGAPRAKHSTLFSALGWGISLLAVLAGGLSSFPALAEKADRLQPMVVESDGKQAASVDLAKKLTVISGHVQVRQGSLQISADKMEIRENAAGQYLSTATALPGGLVQFRQKRDKPDEFIEGEAQVVDYDGAQERVRFSGQAKLKVLRGGKLSDEATAPVIVYDQRADTISFEGTSSTSGNTGTTNPDAGKARLVFQPRTEAASAPGVGR